MSNKRSRSRKSIPKKNTGKLILAIVLLGVVLVIGGKYMIQNRAPDPTKVIVPEFSPEGKSGQVVFQSNVQYAMAKTRLAAKKVHRSSTIFIDPVITRISHSFGL